MIGLIWPDIAAFDAKAQAGQEASAGNPVLMIDLAGDSGEEEATATSGNNGGDTSNSDGKGGDKSCRGAELQSPESTEEPPAPSVDDLPNDFSFCLGKCVASGIVTSGTMSKFSLTDPLALMVEVRVPHTQKWGPQQGFRKAKASNSGYRIVYIHLNDPILLEHQRRLGQPNRRARCSEGDNFPSAAPLNAFWGVKGAKSSSRCSPLAGIDFDNLLSSISEQTTFLRLLIDGREVARFDREVASALAPLLILGAIKVEVCWLPDRMPPRRLAVNSTLSVHMTVHATLQALRLSALRQRGDPYLSQVHFPVLIGQAFESLLHLLAIQPVTAAPSRPEEGNDANDLGLNEEAKIRKCLDGLSERNGPAGPPQSGIGYTRDAAERSLTAAPRTSITEAERGEDSDGANVIDEDNDEVAERSGALCKLVLEERGSSAHVKRQQQRRHRLGTLYPPASMFVSRLRPYQAQGLWWMLQCESEQSLKLEDEDEVDPLWTKYNLPPARAAYGTSDSQYGHTLIPESPSHHKPATTFVPRCFYVNTSSGLVSLEKPRRTGRVRGGILADCMGLGKTVQVLALIALSEFQERDPKGAASWLAASAFGCAHTGETSGTSKATKPVGSPDNQTDAPAEESDVSSASSRSSSPISVSSDGGAADLTPANSDKPLAAVGRNRLLAVDPRILQRTLKRDKDNFLPGGTLIVVPLSLIGQWYAEVQRHLVRGVATVLQYYGPTRPRDPKVLAAYTIVLTSYQTLASDFRHPSKRMQGGRGLNGESHSAHTLDLGSAPESPIASIRFRRVILDEGHIIKNTSSLVNSACNSVEAHSRWILTGTPLQNDLSDAFALVQFLRVSPMGSRRWWRAKVTQAMERGMVREAVETVRSILVPLMLRRHGDQVGEDGKPLLPLPPLTIHTFTLQLTYEERLFYQTIFEHSKEKFDQLVQSGQVLQHYTHVLQLLLRLRQACNHPVLPSYREQQRRQQFIDAICPAQDLLKCHSNDASKGGLNSSSFPRPAPDPVMQKYIQDAVEGKLEECPICLEPPTDAAVLTNCWHVLCATCVLSLLNNSNGAAAACPSCRSKFLHQHVRLLPPGPKACAQGWIQMVQKKHREGLAAADTNAGSKNAKNVATEQTQIADKSCLASELTVASPTECGSAGLKDPAAESEGILHDISDDAFFFSTKMRLLLALLEADVTAGRSCVIFSQWTSMLDLLEMAFARVEAVRSTVHPCTSGASHDGGEDDDVVEVGATHAKGSFLHLRTKSLKNEVARAGGARCAEQEALATPLYDYRRIDGTLGLEARQRIIHCTGDPTDASHSLDAPPQKQLSTASITSESKGAVDISIPRHGKILLLSLKTGNVGLNLVKATRCYILDGWWNPQVEKQAMRRIWRYGQEQPVSVYRFVCARTVEERMEELIEWKGRLSRSTLRSGDRFEQESSLDPDEGDADKRKGRLSLQDLKKLFEGWEADSGSA
ncbi:DNA repair protein, putative [Eimeria brunetti]|uniref:DNA repair protein, putative n=1 Tax=Eimeria brunetti TaxID=51314 RepID=U6LXQ5_9EIME|nr:DNA repair protein, putative [Eimeria brunetti]